MMEQPKPFREVLCGIERYSTKCWVYLSEVDSWNINSPCLVLESEEVPPEREDHPDAGVPDAAKRLKMMQAITVAEVQDVVANAKIQKADVDAETLFRAFLYYYDNDAYLSLG